MLWLKRLALPLAWWLWGCANRAVEWCEWQGPCPRCGSATSIDNPLQSEGYCEDCAYAIEHECHECTLDCDIGKCHTALERVQYMR